MRNEKVCPCVPGLPLLAVVDRDTRVAQGLPPLPEPSDNLNGDSVTTTTKPKATDSKSLNFSSSGSNAVGSKKKRKAVVDLQLQDDDFASLGDMVKGKSSKPVKKKPKKTDKKLLSFGDDA